MFEYGVTIGDKHTYKDWGLACTGVEISEPKSKTFFVSVPCRDGGYDLSEFLTGDIKYENREIKVSFIRREKNFSRWHIKASDISDYCHGQRKNIIFDSNPDFYFAGRIEVESEKEFQGVEHFVISADVEPYKKERYSSTEKWVWNTFCFEGGIIRDYKNLKVDGTRILMIPGRREKVVPVFDCSVSMELAFEGHTYSLPAGRSKILDIRLGTGEHYLEFTGNGVVSVEYRGGRL